MIDLGNYESEELVMVRDLLADYLAVNSHAGSQPSTLLVDLHSKIDSRLDEVGQRDWERMGTDG